MMNTGSINGLKSAAVKRRNMPKSMPDWHLYPLAGLSVLGIKASVLGYSASDTEIGLNLGGGVDFDLSERLVLNVEAKYKIGGEWSRFILSAGVGYKF